MADPIQFQDVADFDIQRQQLARRRKIAEEMMATRMPEARMQGNYAILPGAGNTLDAGLNRILGNWQKPQIDAEEMQNRMAEKDASDLMLSDIPTSGPERTQAQIRAATRMPSLRDAIKMQMVGDEAEANRQFKQQEAEATRLEKSEQEAANRVLKAEEGEANRQNRLDARAVPTVHITTGGGRGGVKAPSGYRYNEDGTALEPIPGGPADKKPGSKPLTAKQLETQRGFMDLESSVANYEQLLDAYDFQGKTAIDPAKRAALEGAYTDVQMKMKTLYELGAPQAGDLKLLSQGIPSPVDLQGTLRGAAFGSSPFKAKLGETRKLLNSSRANFETQFGKATPEAAQPPAAPSSARVRINGKAEFDALPAGTKWETSDGKRGTK